MGNFSKTWSIILKSFCGPHFKALHKILDSCQGNEQYFESIIPTISTVLDIAETQYEPFGFWLGGSKSIAGFDKVDLIFGKDISGNHGKNHGEFITRASSNNRSNRFPTKASDWTLGEAALVLGEDGYSWGHKVFGKLVMGNVILDHSKPPC